MESRAVVGHVGSPSLMPVSKKLILIVARARASGLSWNAAAELVRRTAPTVRYWRDRHKAEWDRCYETAQRETQNEAGAEAVGVLRTQMRHKDIKVAHMAAKALLAWFSRPIARLVEAMPTTDIGRAMLHERSQDEQGLRQIDHDLDQIEIDAQ